LPAMFGRMEIMVKISEIKEVVGKFVKMDGSKINDNVLVNRRAVGGSIMVHRMYAAIEAEFGVKIDDYSDINNFGDLLSKINGKPSVKIANDVNKIESTIDNPLSIGIDLENISNFHEAVDFREDAFYKQNYTNEEISYCILQREPARSFAGLFAAKEALVKADNSLRRLKFNQMNIEHDSGGKPVFGNYTISISHNGDNALAVAVKLNMTGSNAFRDIRIGLVGRFFELAFVVALMTLLFCFYWIIFVR